jgi:hypothetical protein
MFRGRGALVALADVVLDVRAFGQGLVAVADDCGVVDEEVLVAPVVRGDELKPLASLNHLTVPLAMETPP